MFPKVSLKHDYHGCRAVTSIEKPLGVFKTCLEGVLKSQASPVSLWLKTALRDKRVV